jgi:hypothetical protein
MMAFEKLKSFMPILRRCAHWACTVFLVAACAANVSPAQDASKLPMLFRPMRLTYRVEWRLVTAGTADLAFTRGDASKIEVKMKLESAGLLSHLYRVLDEYHAMLNDRFCLESMHMDAQEGKRHKVSQINVDPGHGKSTYEEHDLIKNTSSRTELAVPACTYDITAAITELREIDLQPGKSTTLPVTDGKKFANVRIVARGKENITVNEKKYEAMRYEAFLFDNVLYKRKGSLQIWVSDDAAKLPVQLRFQFGFPVGTVSVELLKEQDL